jgi:hypothetical protein
MGGAVSVENTSEEAAANDDSTAWDYYDAVYHEWGELGITIQSKAHTNNGTREEVWEVLETIEVAEEAGVIAGSLLLAVNGESLANMSERSVLTQRGLAVTNPTLSIAAKPSTCLPMHPGQRRCGWERTTQPHCLNARSSDRQLPLLAFLIGSQLNRQFIYLNANKGPVLFQRDVSLIQKLEISLTVSFT